jgi:hypothetical protein
VYLAVKTETGFEQRSHTLACRLWGPLFVMTMVSLPASMIARSDTLANYKAYLIAFLVPAAVLVAPLGVIPFCRPGTNSKAFACSCLYLTVMLVGAAPGLYPRLLPSTTGSEYDITIAKALSGPSTLHVVDLAGIWNVPGPHLLHHRGPGVRRKSLAGERLRALRRTLSRRPKLPTAIRRSQRFTPDLRPCSAWRLCGCRPEHRTARAERHPPRGWYRSGCFLTWWGLHPSS